MKFDYIIGNPPYQDESSGEQKNYAPPIYHHFMDETYKIADKVELIHPARFLFDAGRTPSKWNKKMLENNHFKILYYEPDGENIFPNNDIKGGIAISFFNKNEIYKPIKVFTPYEEIKTILKKVSNDYNKKPITSIMFNQMKFDLQKLYEAYPEYKKVIGSNGKDKRFRNNIFEKVTLFSEGRTKDCVAVRGVIKNKRVWRYFPNLFIDISHPNLNKWKVIVARVNGSGKLGEVLSNPEILKPMEAYTQTFIGIGNFETEKEAENCLNYIKTKFVRLLLGTLKTTQDNSIDTFRNIPLQDFTENSDIDWSKSISEIDQQLYKKYGLNNEEVKFIETHVKEMK